jgi:hypothetical protein
MRRTNVLPLITRDPVTGGDLIVTRLEGVDSGVVIEGRFGLGWVGRLTPEQLDFVGLLLRHRTNLQKLADETGVAYNTLRSRLDEVVEAIGAPSEPVRRAASTEEKSAIIDRLASGELSVDDAIGALRATPGA